MPGNTDRFFHRQAQGIVRNRIHVAENFGGEAAVIFKTGGGVVDVEFRFDDGFAGIAAFEFREAGSVLPNFISQAKKHAAAFLGSGRRPGAIVECGSGGGDGAVYVLSVGVGDLRDYLFGGRIVNWEGLIGFAARPFAVDIELIGFDVRGHTAGHKFPPAIQVGLRPNGQPRRLSLRGSWCLNRRGFRPRLTDAGLVAPVHKEEKCGQSDKEHRSAEHPGFVS